MGVTGWINLTIFLALLGLALQIAGFVAPMWIWLDVDSFKVGVGLWFREGCGTDGSCVPPSSLSFEYSDDATWSKLEFNVVRAMQTLGMAGGILLLLLIAVYRVGHGTWNSGNMQQLNLAACVTAILTWLCIVTGLIVYCAFYWPVVGTSPLLSSRSFPWSLLMCFLAALLFVIVSVLLRLKCRYRRYAKGALPFSGDSKMDQYPLTKHGLLHRYFLPVYRQFLGNQPATGYTHEAKNVHSMNTRLVESVETDRVAAIDNVAFYDTHLSEANNTRYLPAPNGHALQQEYESVVRRDQPIVTHHSDTDARVHSLPLRHSATNGPLPQRSSGADFLYRYAGEVKHDRIYGGGEDVTRDARYREDRGATTTTTVDVIRDVRYREGGGGGASSGERYRGASNGERYRGAESGERYRGAESGERYRVAESGARADGGVVRQFSSTERHGGAAAYETLGGVITTDVQQHHRTRGQAAGDKAYVVVHSERGDKHAGGARMALHEQQQGGTVTERDVAVDKSRTRRDQYGNIIREERVTTTTTTYYTGEKGGDLRGGELESRDSRLDGYRSHYLSATDLSEASVRPYDDTYIYRPYAESV